MAVNKLYDLAGVPKAVPFDDAANAGQESGMGKILEFRRVKQEAKLLQEMLEDAVDAETFERDIDAIMNDYSLTPANRRWLLENMLMDIDEKLEAYKQELQKAETKLETVVSAAEREIETAYRDFDRHVRGMTKEVKQLTRTRRSRPSQDGNAADHDPSHTMKPHS
jgi:predicted phage tail protein